MLINGKNYGSSSVHLQHTITTQCFECIREMYCTCADASVPSVILKPSWAGNCLAITCSAIYRHITSLQDNAQLNPLRLARHHFLSYYTHTERHRTKLAVRQMERVTCHAYVTVKQSDSGLRRLKLSLIRMPSGPLSPTSFSDNIVAGELSTGGNELITTNVVAAELHSFRWCNHAASQQSLDGSIASPSTLPSVNVVETLSATFCNSDSIDDDFVLGGNSAICKQMNNTKHKWTFGELHKHWQR